MRKLLLVASAALAVACNEADDAPRFTYHRDVAPLIADKCAGCHREGGAAPMALTSYAAALEWADLMGVEVRRRNMPPWPPSAACNTYEHDRSLTQEQIDLISEWAEDGAPEGDPADAPVTTQSIPETTGAFELALPMPEAYLPTIAPDDYRCFIVPWTETSTKYVTGLNVVPGDPRIVHHVIAYVGEPSTRAEYEQMDAEEEGPGYTCFGGSGTDAMPIGSWVPGAMGSMFPAGTGIRIEPGSTLVLQVHYNTSEHEGEDLTTLELALADTVDKPAAILPFTNPRWFDSMPIAAGEPDVVHAFAFDVTRYIGYLLGSAAPVSAGTVRIYSAQLHMHTLGSSAKLKIVRSNANGGGETCLLDIPEWDFHWQGEYWLKDSVLMSPGDQLSIECRWDNSLRNQKVVDGAHVEPRDVDWGEGTSDEMCLSSVYITAP